MNMCILILIKRTLSNSTYEYIVPIGGAFALYYFGVSTQDHYFYIKRLCALVLWNLDQDP